MLQRLETGLDFAGFYVTALLPVVQLISRLVYLVFVTVVRAQQLLCHQVYVGYTSSEVIHLRLQSLKSVVINEQNQGRV